MFKKHVRNENGFTMIEMMVVLIIIAVLIAGGIKFYLGYIENAKVTKAKAQISNMQALMDSWYAENGRYPLSGGGGNTDLTVAGCQLREAGIKATTNGDKSVGDPWGGTNYYTFNTDATGTKYYISTGYTTVQGTEFPVVGNGDKGVSTSPSVIAAVYQ
jgi:general secretion pathway protein G